MYFSYECSLLQGTKNVARQMAKISQGRVRDRGVTWFPELVDKSRGAFIQLNRMNFVHLTYP